MHPPHNWQHTCRIDVTSGDPQKGQKTHIVSCFRFWMGGLKRQRGSLDGINGCDLFGGTCFVCGEAGILRGCESLLKWIGEKGKLFTR